MNVTLKEAKGSIRRAIQNGFKTILIEFNRHNEFIIRATALLVEHGYLDNETDKSLSQETRFQYTITQKAFKEFSKKKC